MALSCAGCGSSLTTIRKATVEIDVCPSCRGVWFDRDEIRPVLVALAADDQLKPDDFHGGPRSVIPPMKIPQRGRRCPRDHSVLLTFNYGYDSNVFLDRCPVCMGIFADDQQLVRLASYVKGNPAQQFLGQLIADTMGGLEAEDSLDAVGSWEGAVGLGASLVTRAWPLGFVAVMDDEPRERFPFITVGLIVMNVVIFALTFFDVLDWRSLALVPEHVTTGTGTFGLLTAVFVHGGVLHIVFNMLYLWIFGDNVEDRFGRTVFLPFYLACGLVASLTQVISDPSSAVPVVGSSGAVAGMLGAYLLLCPRSRVQALFLSRFIEIPAAYFIMGWFVIQLAMALFFPGESDIAWYAHLGGFAAGVLGALGLIQYEAYRRSPQNAG